MSSTLISVSKSPKSRSHDSFDITKHFLNEISSPYTDLPDGDSEEEFEETTTHDPYPFFDELSTQINVTTQLGSGVYLHCKVNDLREKTVSGFSPDFFLLLIKDFFDTFSMKMSIAIQSKNS